MNNPQVYCTNLTVHGKSYVTLTHSGFYRKKIVNRMIETLVQNDSIYYLVDKTLYVQDTGMFHLQMELGHEIDFV